MFVTVLSVFLSLPSPAHRGAPSTPELMRIVLQVMGELIHEVQVCSAVDGCLVCDDATQDLPGDVIGGVGKKLGEVLLCLKLLRNLCAGVERNQDVVWVEWCMCVCVFACTCVCACARVCMIVCDGT